MPLGKPYTLCLSVPHLPNSWNPMSFTQGALWKDKETVYNLGWSPASWIAKEQGPSSKSLGDFFSLQTSRILFRPP